MSLIVTDLNGNTEMLTDYSITRTRKLNKDYAMSIRLFETERNTHSYNHVQKGSELEYDGQIYKVVQLNKRSLGSKSVKNIEAIHIYFDLVYKNQYETFAGSGSIDEFFTFALNGTGFTFEIVDTFEAKIIFNFGADSVFNLIEILKTEFNCEIEQVGRHLKVVNQIGNANSDFQFRYKYNIKTIEENEDITNLETYIRGYGANGLMVEYTSPLASTFGILEAPIYRNDEITDEAELLELIKKEIKEYPQLSYKIEVTDIDGDAKFGDTGFIVHEPFDLLLEARIVEYIDYPETNKSPVVVVGNVIETRKDKQTKLNKQLQSVSKQTEINRSQIRQTDERISLEVEQIGIDYAKKSELTITADEIRSEVSAVETELDGKISSAESSITQNANNIALKVSQTDYNGNTIASLINQSATTIDIQASKINLTGAVSFYDLDSSTQNTINSKVSSSSLGNLAYDDLVSQSQLDSTIIQGGYIKTTLLDVENLAATKIFQKYYPNNYMTVGGNYADLILYRNNSEFFRIYNSLDGVGLRRNGYEYLWSNGTYTNAYGTWDFSSASVTGLNATAKFG